MEMEERMFKVYASGDEKIQLKVIPGHSFFHFHKS